MRVFRSWETLSSVVCVLTVHLLLSGAWQPAIAKDGEEALRVLSIGGTPETQNLTYYNNTAAYMYLADHYLAPEDFLSGDWQVESRDWLRDSEPLAGFEDQDALLLWNSPAMITDKRGTDPFFSDKAVLTTETASGIEAYVREGGALVVAGGVLNYGQAHPDIGSMDRRKGRQREFMGLAYSPLANILPVTISRDVTLARFDGSLGPTTETTLLEGLDISAWPVHAYHRAQLREGAQAPLVSSSGAPLVARWSVGKGRVLCVLAAPRGAGLVESATTAPSPFWPGEAAFWERCLRWATGRDERSDEAESEARARYEGALKLSPRAPLEYLLAEFPFGTDLRSESMPGSMRELSMKYFSDRKMNFVVNAGLFLISEKEKGLGMSLESARNFNARMNESLESIGLYAFYKPEPHRAADKLLELPVEEYGQLTMPGEGYALNYGETRPCPLSPRVIENAARQLDLMGSVVQGSRRIRGFLCDDEWAWVMGYRHCYEGNPGIGSYSPWANAIYEDRTGQPTPLPKYREPGYVAPEEDPWLRWCEIIRQNPARDYNRAISRAAKAHRDDLLISNYPGGFGGEADIVVEEAYLDCWKESELEAFERVDVRSNWLGDYSRDRIPLYVLLGIFRMPEDKSVYPETLRLTIGASLAAGAKGLILWNSENIWAPWLQHVDRDTLENETLATGRYLDKFGPMLLNLSKPPSDFWMLSGWFWVNTFDNYFHVFPTQDVDQVENKDRTWWTFQLSDVAGPALLRSGLPVEFVTEKQLLDESLLSGRKAVFLPGLQYCRQGVVDNLEAFARKGGRVYLDESAAVEISGATVLPIDFAKWHHDVRQGKRPIAQPNEEMYRKHRGLREAYVSEAIDLFRREVLPEYDLPVTIRDSDAAWRMLANGEARYLFVLNANTDVPRSFDLECHGLGSHVYDIESGRRVDAKGDAARLRFGVDLPAGGWKIFACSPRGVGQLELQEASVSPRIRVSARLLDTQGKSLSMAVPVAVTVLMEDGREYLFHAATDEGQLALDLPSPLEGKAKSVTARLLFSE